MTLFAYKLLAAVLLFLTSLATGLYPLRKQHLQGRLESTQLAEAFASGIFLGAAFFHMLPDALQVFPAGTLLPESLAVLGFLIPLFFERLSLVHSPQRGAVLILFVTLTIHALTEGAALGTSLHLSETIVLLIAIIVHKGSESFALASVLVPSTVRFKRAACIVILFACMTPLGILCGTSLQGSELFTAGINAFAAGTFLYVSTLHHIHFHQHEHDTRGLLEFFSLLLGTAVMACLGLV